MSLKKAETKSFGFFYAHGWAVWLREAGAEAADVQDERYERGRQEPKRSGLCARKNFFNKPIYAQFETGRYGRESWMPPQPIFKQNKIFLLIKLQIDQAA